MNQRTFLKGNREQLTNKIFEENGKISRKVTRSKEESLTLENNKDNVKKN